MGSRVPSHKLSGGLYVSGRPDQMKERSPTMASRAVPYTGGDVKKSGELGKMFDIAVVDPSQEAPQAKFHSFPTTQLGSGRSGSGKQQRRSGQMTALQPTGLITSGQLVGSRVLGHTETTASAGKMVYGQAVTNLTEEVKLGFKVSRAAVWVFLVAAAMGLLVGAFLMVAVKKAVILVAMAAVFIPAAGVIFWNCAYGKNGLLGFLRRYPDAELRGAFDGQFVKITGVVTCGSIPLEASYERIPRCVYVSTELYEYRGLTGKPVNPKHRIFSWGCRHSEKYVADFYISDFQSGLRALVKAGYGAKVVPPFTKPATVIHLSGETEEASPNLRQWMADRHLSQNPSLMRLKEGYIKEGSTVSVMGTVRRHDNVVMIVAPPQPVTTGCRWICCLFPAYIGGLVVTCEDTVNENVVPV